MSFNVSALVEMINNESITREKLTSTAPSGVDWFSPEGESLLVELLAASIGFLDVIEWLEDEPFYLRHETAFIFFETLIMNPDSYNYCAKYRVEYVKKFINHGYPLHYLRPAFAQAISWTPSIHQRKS